MSYPAPLAAPHGPSEHLARLHSEYCILRDQFDRAIEVVYPGETGDLWARVGASWRIFVAGLADYIRSELEQPAEADWVASHPDQLREVPDHQTMDPVMALVLAKMDLARMARLRSRLKSVPKARHTPMAEVSLDPATKVLFIRGTSWPLGEATARDGKYGLTPALASVLQELITAYPASVPLGSADAMKAKLSRLKHVLEAARCPAHVERTKGMSRLVITC